MKKQNLFLMALMMSSVIYSQTVTNSNAAVFDGDNLALNQPILELGKLSNGGVFEFKTGDSGSSTSVGSFIKDANGTLRMNYNFNLPNLGNNGTSVLEYADSNSNPYFRLYDLNSTGVFLTLNRPNSQLVIGGNFTPFSHKFIVKSGNSFFDGNVGINTENFIDAADNNQEYKLSVGGRIRAEAVKVYTDWADFVFEDNYKLPTLKEVEAYINENGHLKDIPSAEDVEAKGIELGEMNKLLLQKIEELTLYTIEQQKLIEELYKDVQKLKTKT